MTDVTNSETVDYNEAMEPIRNAAKEVNETPQQEEKLIGKLPDEVVEHIKPKSKKKSAKEKFAESTGFDVDEVKETEPQIDKEDLGLTSSVEEEDTTKETAGRSVYQASAVDKVPAPIKEGMHILGVGRRRQVKRTKEKQAPRINRNTSKAFPDKGIGSVNKTTFRG